MGFFSRIKKLWGTEEAPSQTPMPEEAQELPAAEAEATVLKPEPIVPESEAIIPEPEQLLPATEALIPDAEQPRPVDETAAPEELLAETKMETSISEPAAVLFEAEPDHGQPIDVVFLDKPEESAAGTDALRAEADDATAPESIASTSDAQRFEADDHPIKSQVENHVVPTVLQEQPDAEISPETLPITLQEPSEHEETKEEIAGLQKQDTVETSKKTSGWRKFFGLGSKEESAQPVDVSPEPQLAQPELLFQEKPTAKSDLEPWQEQLVAALKSAEPRLSIWMVHLLDGVDRRGEALWSRLRFLFVQLEIPAEEAQDFITRFDKWLGDMDYDHVDEFRSELQYRMALALDLEDEEDERNRLFLKLSAGLGKTREQLTKRIDQLLALTGSYDDAFWEELEEILLMADVGFTATQELLNRLKPKIRKAGDDADFKALLKEELASVFKEATPVSVAPGPEVVLMVGVNGAGKTTTIAKLAHRAQMQGRKVLVAAGDTFRAAAIEQLQVWAKRVGAGFYAKTHGSDPAAVAFEALDHAVKEGYDLVFVDTAGRLQTKHNLMEELKKINRVLGKKLEGAPHRTILVLDATTGQNALSQVKLFSQASPVDEIVLTKLDGTAKGGIIVAIALEFGIPISFVGLGEKMEDLRPFSGQEFANALFG